MRLVNVNFRARIDKKEQQRAIRIFYRAPADLCTSTVSPVVGHQFDWVHAGGA
jgi:hypothetical protein